MVRRTIKLFLFVQNVIRMLGIYPPLEDGKVPFNSRNLFVLFCYAQLWIPVALYFVLKANTMQEYGATVFIILTFFYIALDVLILMWQMYNILNLIASFEEFIKKRKLQTQ